MPTHLRSNDIRDVRRGRALGRLLSVDDLSVSSISTSDGGRGSDRRRSGHAGEPARRDAAKAERPARSATVRLTGAQCRLSKCGAARMRTPAARLAPAMVPARPAAAPRLLRPPTPSTRRACSDRLATSAVLCASRSAASSSGNRATRRAVSSPSDAPIANVRRPRSRRQTESCSRELRSPKSASALWALIGVRCRLWTWASA